MLIKIFKNKEYKFEINDLVVVPIQLTDEQVKIITSKKDLMKRVYQDIDSFLDAVLIGTNYSEKIVTINIDYDDLSKILKVNNFLKKELGQEQGLTHVIDLIVIKIKYYYSYL